MKKITIIILSIAICFICSCSSRVITIQLGGYDQGSLLMSEENYIEALAFYEKELNESLRSYGKNSSRTALVYNNLGHVYNCLGEYERSMTYTNKSRLINETLDDEQALAMNYSTLGDSYYGLKEYTTALTNYEKSLKINKRRNGEVSPSVINTIFSMSDCYFSQGDHEQAMSLIDEIIKADMKQNGKDYNYLRYLYNKKAEIFLKLEDNDNAKMSYIEAIESCKPLRIPDSKFQADTYVKLGALCSETEPMNAEEYYNEAIDVYSWDYFDRWINEQTETTLKLMRLCRERGDMEEALRYGIEGAGRIENAPSDLKINLETKNKLKDELKSIYVQIKKEEPDSFDTWYLENTSDSGGENEGEKREDN